MGGRTWTDEEVELVRSKWGRIPDTELSKALNRTIGAIRAAAGKRKIRSARPAHGGGTIQHTHDEMMGCRDRVRQSCWTVDDVMRLELRYGTEPVEKTARALKRSVWAVRVKASRLGVRSRDQEEAA